MRNDPFHDPRRLVEAVYAYVATMIGDGPAAQDITSETIVRGLRYRASYDAAKGAPATWLIGIARKRLAEQRTPDGLGGEAVPEVAALGDLEGEAVDRVALHAALADLPARDRELIALRYGSDLTARQIGELLGLRTNAVEVALTRALARLRTSFAVQADATAPRKGFGLANGM